MSSNSFYLCISAYYHDASVALLNSEGNLVDFKKEEWLSRVKGDKSFPRLALQEMIKNFNLSENNIEKVCFYEKPLKAWLKILNYSIKNNSLVNELTRNYFKNITLNWMGAYLSHSGGCLRTICEMDKE